MIGQVLKEHIIDGDESWVEGDEWIRVVPGVIERVEVEVEVEVRVRVIKPGHLLLDE